MLDLSAITPVVVGFFLALFFKPYYDFLKERVRNPTLAVTLLFASVLVPLYFFCRCAGGLVVDQVDALTAQAPHLWTSGRTWILERWPVVAPYVPDAEELTSDLQTFGFKAAKAGFGMIGGLSGFVSILMALIFFVSFLMTSVPSIPHFVDELPFLKPETRTFVVEQVEAFVNIIVGFFRRQMLICLAEGCLYGLGFWCVGLPYGFLLGFALGLLNLVPLLGSLCVLPVAIPLAYFAEGGSLGRLIAILVVWIVGMVLDSYVITPRIQGKSTGLGTLGVIFSFFFWGTLFHSFLGLLLAVPLSAFCVVFVRALRSRSRGFV